MSIRVSTIPSQTRPQSLSHETPAEVDLQARPQQPASGDGVLWERLSRQETQVLDNPSDPHVTQYLETVRHILNRALARHRAKSATYWSPKGEFRQMIYVEEVNHALRDLLDVIRSGHPATQLARRLDTIRGLLVDLWM